MIYTLVPLGNPGNKYANTRHNAARVLLHTVYEDVLLIPSLEVFVPETFMNESGKAISDYLRYHEGRELVVMYDDKDLAYGTLRISYDRGNGGHNGVKSVIESLGTKNFIRIRIGIGPKSMLEGTSKAPSGAEVQDYVMGIIRPDEEEDLRALAPKVLASLKTIIEHGYQKAMEKYN